MLKQTDTIPLVIGSSFGLLPHMFWYEVEAITPREPQPNTAAPAPAALDEAPAPPEVFVNATRGIQLSHSHGLAALRRFDRLLGRRDAPGKIRLIRLMKI